ncbi:hypothetical protein MNBD_GAMMA22-2475 [hydrothermal vent metagenome]|uniref:DUF1800 domain-containing protein n=1 Tax=hydrothermal vent metagenome TaxID=652676 RepID=A0A3B0ZXU8_9ZZZZ
MYRLKRNFVFFLCLCMAGYSIPVLAYALNSDNVSEENVSKVELTDEAMQDIQGAGNIDATMLDYKVGGTQAQAIVVNRSGINATYVMDVVDFNNNVLEVLKTGQLLPNELKMVRGVPTLLGTQNRNVRISLQAFGGHVSVDTSFANSSIDSDIDGITDWNEKLHGLNPYDAADAILDNDGDTLTNIDEINVYKTDPNNTDTDADGLADNIEIQNNLNPLNPADATLDADNDFVTNIDEILVYNTDPYVANPGLAPDTDGDGVLDAVELALGTDLNDPLSNTVGLDDAASKRIIHFLNRTTFGPTVDLVNEVNLKGEFTWLEEQLIPTTLDSGIDDTQTIRETSFITFSRVEKLGSVRPVHSIKQLQARMGLFWDNHFSTSINETRWYSELHEEDRFYENALGNFRTLLGMSAKGDAMLRYLDLLQSTAAGANENYAREVMELHTLGTTITDGDYTGEDIAQLARILTGWSIVLDTTVPSRYKTYVGNNTFRDSLFYNFLFKPARHDFGEKLYLGQVFPAGIGEEEGDRALDLLAAHDSTANFICLKLALHFVSDNPAPQTLTDCAATFKLHGTSPDQIAHVLRTLINSAEFNELTTERNKFKDHQEYIFSLARLLNWKAVGNVPANGIIPANVVGDIIARMGQRQFAKAEPTGWAEDVAGGWLSANSALHRFREGNRMSFSGITQLAVQFKAQGITSSGDVMANLFMLMLGGNYTKDHMVMGYWLLHPNNATFDLNTMSPFVANARIRNLVSRVAQLPEFSAQ